MSEATTTPPSTSLSDEISSALSAFPTSSVDSETSTQLISRTTTADGTTSILVITSTVIFTPTPTTTSSDSNSTDQAGGSTAIATQIPSSKLSTASIVGIALGSVAGGILIILLLLFTLGFRIQRGKLRRHGKLTEAPERRDERPVAAATSGTPYGKAELPDAEYTGRIERLHNGVKPELDGSTAQKLAWRFFSIRSASRQGTRHAPAELGTEPPVSSPHELPGDGILQTRSEEPRQTRDAM